MTQKSPLSYYADNSVPIKKSKKRKQNAKKNLFDSAFNRHEKIAKSLDDVAAYPMLVDKLRDWNDRQKLRWIRHNADMKHVAYLPEILFMTGNGMVTKPLDKIANFCWQTGFLKNPKVKSYDVNDFIKHYVTDSKETIDSIFKNETPCLLDFYGFDKLIANPRPPMADWHDWLNIIVNYLIDNINEYGFMYPVIFNLSESARGTLYNRFERLHKYDCETVKINRLTPKSMYGLVVEKLRNKTFNITPQALTLLENLVVKLYNEKRLKEFSEYQIRDYIFNDIINRQGQRIFDIPKQKLTRKKVRIITKGDIPTQIFFAANDIIFY